ncbi:hypothetical protein EBU99_08915 [bacterium]|nr:hypothetical protein [bacterium]
MTTVLDTQSYAFFDVDGTVIARDSFRILIRELVFKKSWWRSLLAGLLCFALGVLKIFSLVGKTQFKSALLWCATVGYSRKQAIRLLQQVTREKVAPLWFREVNAELERLRSDGLRICYVSASGKTWLRTLLSIHDPGKKVIVGSQLMFFLGGITLRGANCLGVEKIIRLRQLIPHQAIWFVAYSDHRADLPLLSASRHRVVVNPSKKNQKAISRSLGADGFVVVNWTPLNKSE